MPLDLDMVPAPGHANGHLPTLPSAPTGDAASITAVVEQAWAQLNARDAAAEQHAWLWHRCALWLSGILAVAVLVIAWLVWTHRDVQAFVQVVQMDGARLVQIGVPLALLAYTPPEAAWQDMLAEWLRRVYWRGADPDKAEKVDWRWVELHTCPSARAFLDGLKARQQPGKKTTSRVQVTVKTITKTPTPASYQVLWEHLVTGPDTPRGKAELFTTTFTVGRLAPTTLDEAEDNRLGLCVASFDTHQHSD